MSASTEFLLGVAGVSATLLGTFIVGVFFYIDSDQHRMLSATVAADRYRRSAIRWVFAAYAVPVLVPLALVGAGPVGGVVAFIVLGAILAATTVDTGRRISMTGGSGSSAALIINEWATTLVVVVAVALPWVLGGWLPAVGDFTLSLLLVLAAGFSSTAALVMAQFDESVGTPEAPSDRRPRHGDGDGPDAQHATDAAGDHEPLPCWVVSSMPVVAMPRGRVPSTGCRSDRLADPSSHEREAPSSREILLPGWRGRRRGSLTGRPCRCRPRAPRP